MVKLIFSRYNYIKHKPSISFKPSPLLVKNAGKQKWCINVQVIQALVNLVNEPEPEHPLRADLAEEYTKERKKFMKNAEEFTKKNGEKRPSD